MIFERKRKIDSRSCSSRIRIRNYENRFRDPVQKKFGLRPPNIRYIPVYIFLFRRWGHGGDSGRPANRRYSAPSTGGPSTPGQYPDQKYCFEYLIYIGLDFQVVFLDVWRFDIVLIESYFRNSE